MIIADFFAALYTDIVAYFSKPIGFDTPLSSGQVIIWAIIAGFAVAGLIALYNRVFLGRFVSFLLKNGANDPSSARSAEQAGIKNIFLRCALSSNGVFRKLVITEDTDSKISVLKRRYFIPEGSIMRAERLYTRNGASPFSLIISLILLIVMACIIYVALPELIQMTKNFAKMIK